MSSLRGFNGEKRQTDIINQLIKIDSKTGVLPTGGASEAKQDTIIANQTNGTQESKCMGIDTATSLQHQLKVASDGALHIISENFDSMLIKGVETGTTTQRDCKQNANGDLRSALIGNTAKDGTGTNYYVLVDSDGKLETSGGGGGSSSLTFSTATIINAGTTVADFASAEGIIDLGSTVPETGTPKEIYITTTMTVAVSATIEIQLSVDNITYFQDFSFSSAFISSLSNLTRSSTIVNPSGYSTFSFPRYVKFIFRNQDGTGQSTDMGLKINYYA